MGMSDSLLRDLNFGLDLDARFDGNLSHPRVFPFSDVCVHVHAGEGVRACVRARVPVCLSVGGAGGWSCVHVCVRAACMRPAGRPARSPHHPRAIRLLMNTCPADRPIRFRRGRAVCGAQLVHRRKSEQVLRPLLQLAGLVPGAHRRRRQPDSGRQLRRPELLKLRRRALNRARRLPLGGRAGVCWGVC